MKRGRQRTLAEWSQSDESARKRRPAAPEAIKRPGLHLSFNRDFLSGNEADELMRALEATVEYGSAEETAVWMFGKKIPVPRKQAAFGDPGTSYRFAGQTVEAAPWPAELKAVERRIAHALGRSFNFVLVNRYQNGKDYMGFHRDNEPDLDEGAPIASISLGAERDFVFRHADAKRGRGEHAQESDVKLRLGHGSLLAMLPPTNEHWYHALPKRLRVDTARINLTFRVMLSPRDARAGAAPGAAAKS